MIKTYVWNHSYVNDDFNNSICNRTRAFAEVDNNLPIIVYEKFSDIITDAVNNNYDVIEVIGNGCIVASATERHNLVKDLKGECYAHILHTGLWDSVGDENFYTLHEQYIILKLSAIKKLVNVDLDQSFSIYNQWPSIKRSKENVHDNYTPLWIKKENDKKINVSKGKSKFGKLEHLIITLLENNIEIHNVPNSIRNLNQYSYHANNLDDAKMWFDKPINEVTANKDKIDESIYKFLKKIKNEDKIWAYNTEDIPNDLSLSFDTLITPAAGSMPFAYLEKNTFEGRIKVFVVDINQNTLNFCKWFVDYFDPSNYEIWSDIVKKFLKETNLQNVAICGNENKANKQWINLYANIKHKWKNIKQNVFFEFKNGNIIEDKEYIANIIKEGNFPFVHLSNCFRYNGTFNKPYTTESVKNYINFLYSNNIKSNYKIILPEAKEVCYSNLVQQKGNNKDEFFISQDIPELPRKVISQEIKRLEENKLFTKHRGDIHPGWESFVLHGLGYNKTEAYERYGYESDIEAPHHWTEEALTHCPRTVEYFQKNKIMKQYFRVRIMKLAPGGYINIHDDDPNKHRTQWALNIAVNNPDGCEMHFWDNDMIYKGQVPWKPGQAFRIRVHWNHMVRNFSDTTRYHIIVHGIR